MIGSYVLSGVLSLVFLISYLFVITDIEGAINHPTGYPFLYVFEQAFSMEAVNALTSIVIVLIWAGRSRRHVEVRRFHSESSLAARR